MNGDVQNVNYVFMKVCKLTCTLFLTKLDSCFANVAMTKVCISFF